MSFLSSALTSIGTSLLGKGISAGADYLFKNFLPEGAQSFLSGAGKTLGIGKKDIANMTDEAAATYLKRKEALRSREGPDPQMMSVGSTMAAGSMSGAGPGAQMLPLGSTDRVSRALQDARVAEKIMRMSGQAPIPTSNIRTGQTIGLGSATAPRTTLTKKYSQ
jgi:hypothetical protein